MEFKQIRCFVAAAEALNFTTAAERMYLSQPSLSRHIQNLEDELGMQLFARDRKHVALTPAGEHLLPIAQEICASRHRFYAAAKDLREGNRGFLRIGYQGSARMVLSPILERFFNYFPNVQISVEEMGAHPLMQSIHTGRVDLGIAFSLVREGFHDGENLCSQTLFVDQMALFLSRKTLDRYTGQSVQLRDFHHETFLQISKEENPSYFEFLRRLYNQHNFQPARLRETSRLEALMMLVQLGNGVSLLPKQANLTYYPDACCVALSDVQVSLPIEAVWRSQNSNPCLSLFRNFLGDLSRKQMDLSPPKISV